MNNKTLVIIPAYNVDQHISKVIKGVMSTGVDYVVINDGSTDNTESVLEELNASFISISTNSGMSNAIKTGIQYSFDNSYEKVILMDADGQHSPEDIQRFIFSLDRYDMAFGNRFSSLEGIPTCKIASNMFASALYEMLTKKYIPDIACGYKGFHLTEALYNYLSNSDGYQITYDLVNYAMERNYSIDMVNIKAIYPVDNLLLTRRSELKALLCSAKRLSALDATQTLSYLDNRIELSADFHVCLSEKHFYAFFIPSYDGYIFQVSAK